MFVQYIQVFLDYSHNELPYFLFLPIVRLFSKQKTFERLCYLFHSNAFVSALCNLNIVRMGNKRDISEPMVQIRLQTVIIRIEA